MILYLMAAAVCVAAVAGYAWEQDSIVALFCIGLPLYVYATRGTKLRLDVAFTTVMLCATGAVAAVLAVLFWIDGSHVAAAATALAATSTAYVARIEVPIGVRVMRVALRRASAPAAPRVAW